MFMRLRPGNWYPEQNSSNSNHQQVSKFTEQTEFRVPTLPKRFQEQMENTVPPFVQLKEPIEVIMDEGNLSKENMKEKPELDDTKTSATSKALQQMEVEGEVKKAKWTGHGKISTKLKRQKMNLKLAKILTPKNALILLHEIKPGCSYITKETPSQGNLGSIGFTVQVKHEKDILGIGQGVSKSQAKNLAAENAIKTLFSKAVKSISEEGQVHQEDEESLAIFPWAGLAQFAMYKMFNEWQLQNPDLPPNDIQKFLNFAKGPKATPKQTTPSLSQTKKELPPDAQNLHPTAVLNNLHPGLTCIELERTLGPPSRVKMAFELNGKQYCGVSTNKKEAKKEAAKVLLSAVYGVKYES